ncbi:MAG: hypothetical protein IJT73_12055 [Selenomonadaceae bacterium]|nr:hypothetical protein [Selenomonadaceae bacterium]
MASLHRKILKKLNPKPKKPVKPPEKVGKDYILIVILSLTIIFMVLGWSSFDNTNRALYVALAVSLSATYARRHWSKNETQDTWFDRISFIAMIAAIVLFIMEIYIKFIA